MKIAVLQMCSGIHPVRNVAVIANALADAARAGATMLFTPEMSVLLDSRRDRAREHLNPAAYQSTLAELCAACASHNIWLNLGSMAVDLGRNDGLLANRGFVIDNHGIARAQYDKIHLFDVDLQTGETWRESNAYVAGDVPVIVDCPLGKIGLSICYDVRFPALYAELSSSGAELLSIPAAFTVPTGQAHWHVLLKARAIENACFVIAAAQGGTHEDGRKTFGHSLVIDPWGEVLLDMEDTGLGFVYLDLARVREVRARIPVLAHRRPISHIAPR